MCVSYLSVFAHWIYSFLLLPHNWYPLHDEDWQNPWRQRHLQISKYIIIFPMPPYLFPKNYLSSRSTMETISSGFWSHRLYPFPRSKSQCYLLFNPHRYLGTQGLWSTVGSGVRKEEAVCSPPVLSFLRYEDTAAAGLMCAGGKHSQTSCPSTRPELLIQWIVNSSALQCVPTAGNRSSSRKRSLRPLPFHWGSSRF